MTPETQRGGTVRTRVATIITEVFSPVILAVLLVVAVGVVYGTPPVSGLAWGLVAAVFVGAIPYAFLLLGIRRGRWAGRHIPLREERTVPLVFAGASALIGIVLMAVGGAPQQLVALVIAGVAGLVVTVVITLRWKMSIHTGVAGGTATVLMLVFGGPAIVAWPVVAAIGWSRLELRDHTLAQVVVGAAVGALIAGSVYSALR